MNVYEKIGDWLAPGKVITRQTLAGLLFGQQHLGKQAFFEAQGYKQTHTIELRQLPHYRFLRDHLDRPFSNHPYARYLAQSWTYGPHRKQNTPQQRQQQISRFLSLYKDIQSRRHQGARAIQKPLRLCQRPDGRLVIVDGNHRGSIALALGLDVRAKFVPLARQLAKIASVPEEFFGSKRLDRPYQSIYFEGKELVRGRRRDVWERIEKIKARDLEGKSVLDLGCNFGMSSFLATERGARRTLGIDYSPRIISAAARLNAYFARPCRFIAHDLNQDPPLNTRFDTVFCFSLLKHLKSTKAITALIKRATGQVLYFEAHAHTTKEDYPELFAQGHFRKVELVDYLSNGVHSSKRTRAFYRCEV